MKKILGESHFLVISHWTPDATKNESVFEEKAHPLLLSQACQARLGMTKRVRESSITIDDSQLSEVARQEGTRLFSIRIDHLVHDDHVCNSLLDDLAINSGAKPDVNNVARGTDQPCSPDCSTHAMVDDSRRIFPRSVLQADTIIVSCGPANFERASWSTQRFHESWGPRDELATAADFDKFLGSFEDNYTGVCDGRSVWMTDCKKLDDLDCDKNPRIHVGRNPRSNMGPKDCHEQHSRPYDDMYRFLSGKNVVVAMYKNGRRRSVANAGSRSNMLTR